MGLMLIYRSHIPPLPAGLDALNSAQLLSGELKSNVGVALNLVGGAGPRPRSVPGDSAAAQRVNAGALLAGGVGALAPEVVVNNVATGGSRSPLVTEVGTAVKSLGGDGCGVAHGGQRHSKERKRCEGLHVGHGVGRKE